MQLNYQNLKNVCSFIDLMDNQAPCLL